MFSGISKSLIPIQTQEYVVKEIVKAILVNQEILCLPSIVYFLLVGRSILPAKSFLWFHRAIGAASTMDNFTGREGAAKQSLLEKQTKADIGSLDGKQISISIPDKNIKEQNQQVQVKVL